MLDLKVTKASKAILDLKVMQDLKGSKASKVKQVRRVIPDLKAIRVPKGIKATKAPPLIIQPLLNRKLPIQKGRFITSFFIV
jgi:hypothetical protein